MVERTQVTPAVVGTLKWARDQAASWRGSHDPGSHPEFDAWIREVDEAIIAVKHDRRRLQTFYAGERK